MDNNVIKDNNKYTFLGNISKYGTFLIQNKYVEVRILGNKYVKIGTKLFFFCKKIIQIIQAREENSNKFNEYSLKDKSSYFFMRR